MTSFFLTWYASTFLLLSLAHVSPLVGLLTVSAYFRIEGKRPTCSKRASYLGNTS